MPSKPNPKPKLLSRLLDLVDDNFREAIESHIDKVAGVDVNAEDDDAPFDLPADWKPIQDWLHSQQQLGMADRGSRSEKLRLPAIRAYIARAEGSYSWQQILDKWCPCGGQHEKYWKYTEPKTASYICYTSLSAEVRLLQRTLASCAIDLWSK